MRRRLYFLLPDVAVTKKVMDELLLAHIDDHHIHVIAKEGTPLGDLPEANLLQKSDVVHATELGLSVGGATGVLAGVGAVTLLVLNPAVALGTALAGAGVGAWISSMIGISIPNTRIKEFESAIEAGEVLLMVDAPKPRVDEITNMIKQHHPEADVEGTEPTIPAFP